MEGALSNNQFFNPGRSNMRRAGFLQSLLLVFIILMISMPASAEAKRLKKDEAGRQKAASPQSKGDESPCKGFAVMEAETGLIIEAENQKIKWPMASITKLMLACIVLDKLESGQIKLDDKITVSQEASSMGGSQVYLKPGEVFTLDELMKAVMVASANDAAYAVAEFIAGTRNAFVDMMNEKAKALNLTDTEFFSPHGLPPSNGQLPDVSSPQDLATLSRELVKRPQLLAWTSLKTAPFRDNSLIMRNHNNLMQRFAGMDGLKTGYYREAGYSIVATAKREDMRLIAVVMGSPTAKVRDNLVNEKLKKAFAQYQMVRLVKKGEQADKEVALPDGKQKTVRPVAASDFSYPIARDKRRLLTKTFELPDRIKGEIKQGQRLGEIVIRLGNDIIAKVDMISPVDVPKKGLVSRILD
jgi:D-alanyl-D-alanine carboxypeptidase (penicillin-binding protein 5/6)